MNLDDFIEKAYGMAPSSMSFTLFSCLLFMHLR